MASLDPSEGNKIPLTDIRRLLISMQQTSREDLDNNPVIEYPLWLIWELYQRLVRWKLKTNDAIRNVVPGPPTLAQDYKRIQNRCDNTKVDFQTIKLLFTTLLLYSQKHAISKLKQKPYLKKKEKQAKQIVVYNSIGEKKIMQICPTGGLCNSRGR